MKVKEMIEHLQKYDMEQVVIIKGTITGNFPTINHEYGNFTTISKIKIILTKEQYMQNCYKLN